MEEFTILSIDFDNFHSPEHGNTDSQWKKKPILLSIIFEKKQILIDFHSPSICRNLDFQWENLRFFFKYRFHRLNCLCRNFDSHPPHVEISIINGRIYDF